MNDVFDLQRFVDAQAAVYDRALAELRKGRKQRHWMWFIFPQIEGLGASRTSRKFAIASPEEARAYEAHAVLGPRLRECTQLVLDVQGRTAEQIFPYPDDMKFRSSMTLFMQTCSRPHLFEEALRKYFQSTPDALTLKILGAMRSGPLLRDAGGDHPDA